MAVSTNVGSIHYDLNLDTSKFDSASSRVSGSLSKLGGMLKTFGLMAGVAGAAATTFAVKSAADFEQTRIALENMLGSADEARNLLDEISEFAKKTPFAFDELATTTKQLIAFGFGAEDALETMKNLGDVAAGVGVPMGDLTYLMGTLRTQGRAFTIDIRQFAQRGIPIYEYLAKVLGETEEAVMGLIEEGKIGFPEVEKAFKSMTSEGGKFYNTMEKQSQSLRGRFETLLDTVGQFGRELVGISASGDIEEGSLFAGLSNFVEKATRGAEVALPALKAGIKEVADYLSGLGGIFMQIAQPAIDNFVKVIQDNAPMFRQFTEDVLKPMGQVLATVIAVAFSTIVNAISFIIQAIAVLKQGFEELLLKLKPITDYLRQNVWPIVKFIADFLIKEFKSAWDAVKKAFDDVAKVLQDLGINIDGVQILLGVLMAIVVMILAPIVILAGMIIAVSLAIAEVTKWIALFISWLINLTRQAHATIAEFTNRFIEGIARVIQWFRDLPANIVRALANLPSQMASAGRNIIDGLINGITDAGRRVYSTVKNIATNMMSTIKKTLGINSPSRVFMGYGQNIIDGLAIGLDKRVDVATNAIAKVNKSLTGGFNMNIGTGENKSPSITHNGDIIIHDRNDVSAVADMFGYKQLNANFGVGR